NAAWYTDDVRIGGVVNAALAIAAGLCEVVVVAAAQAGAYTDRAAVVPWTRQPNEFVECWGFTTPGEMAMMARRHMHQYGTTPERRVGKGCGWGGAAWRRRERERSA